METINAVPNLQEYFYKMIRHAVINQAVEASPETEFYLVQLLARFSKAEHLYNNERGQLEEEALFSILERALEANHELRILLLKRLGDIALYFAGYFPESLSRKLVDLDYYMQMGGTAYRSLSSIMPQEHCRELYYNLSDKFDSWVDILSEVSAQTQVRHSEQDLLKLYENWQKTGSRFTLSLLQQEGIIPHSGSDESH